MQRLFDQFRTPVPQPSEKSPIHLIWKVKGERKEKNAPDMKSARLLALNIIRGDDRIQVGLYDRKSKAYWGKVGLYAGCPYWLYKGEYKSLNKDGTLAYDQYDF